MQTLHDIEIIRDEVIQACELGEAIPGLEAMVIEYGQKTLDLEQYAYMPIFHQMLDYIRMKKKQYGIQ